MNTRFTPAALLSVALLVFALPWLAAGQEEPTDDPFGGDPGVDPFAAQPTGDDAPFAAGPADPTQKVFWATPRSEQELAIEEKLDQPLTSVGLDFQDSPLEEITDFLSQEYGFQIHIDVAALDDLGLGADEPINVNLRSVSLRNALKLMLGPFELTTAVTNDCLIVTTRESAETRLCGAVYPVGDLTNDVEELADVLIDTVASNTWADNGGGEAEIRPVGGTLVVSQTEAVHREIINTLTAIRRASQSLDSGGGAVVTDDAATAVTRGYRLVEIAAPTEESIKVVAVIRGAVPELAAGESDKRDLQAIGGQIVVHASPSIQQKVKRLLDNAGLLHPYPGGGNFCGGQRGPSPTLAD